MEDGDSSYEEDFSEVTQMFSTDVELPNEKTKKEESPFEILSMENIAQEVFDIIMKVQAFLALPTTISARMLLTHYKWDFQRLIGEYYESGREAFFQSAPIENPFAEDEESNTPTRNDSEQDCKICFSDSPEQLFALKCGHKYCTSCWNHYLTVKIADEGLNESIVCPEATCKILVDDEHVIQLVEDPEVIRKYQRSMSNDFVQNNNSFRWCPFPGCTYAARKHRNAKYPCACKCGLEFCFDCAEYWHEPVTCILLKQWKNSGDSETLQWIAEHAKICPGCEAVIEKNGGCNHMTCRNCKHEFCWICMDEWRSHRACNRFDESKAIGHREFARFQHFRDRYVNQLESLRLEGIAYSNLETKINDMKDNFSMTNNEVRFLRDAVKVLHVSRRTLCYTFVFAYFLKKNNQVEMFEDNQSDLESAVERLSEYLEEEITTENVTELKINIQDSFKYCEQRCSVLMDHIREAEENNLWEKTN